MTPEIRLDLSERVLTIRIARPAKKNALTLDMYRAMTTALDDGNTDDAVRVVLLTGGDEAFTAGNDLGDFLQAPPVDDDSPVMRFLRTLRGFDKPLVAAVNGVAIGIGTTLLLHCDLVYAGEGARFHLPFVDLGLVPEAASSYLLPLTLGQRLAAELLLLAEPFDAGTARAYGLVNDVLAPEEVEAHARQQALALAAKAPTALRLTRRLMKRAFSEEIAEAMAVEGEHFVDQLRGPEAQEALEAFMARRKPDFSRF